MGSQKARRLNSFKKSTPQCEQELEEYQFNTYYRQRRKYHAEEKGFEIGRCLNHSAYNVDGENLCGSHARTKALNLMLGENL